MVKVFFDYMDFDSRLTPVYDRRPFISRERHHEAFFGFHFITTI